MKGGTFVFGVDAGKAALAKFVVYGAYAVVDDLALSLPAAPSWLLGLSGLGILALMRRAARS